jgi:peptide/nickel transport system substrate-binding protein
VDEAALRQLIGDVQAGRVGRRQFVRAMVGLGLTAPMAADMLTAGGVSAGPQSEAFAPARRGGGGNLRILMWDAPTFLHPHFGRGLRDFTASRIFYEPLAVAAADGSFVPVLADEMPSRANGGVARDGLWVVWRLKRNAAWHDGTPFTADDVIFNWEFAADPATAASSRAAYDEIARVDKLDSHTVKVVFKRPQPFWTRAFAGDGLLPRHVFERHKGAGAREALGTVKAVGTGPYRVVDFKPGDAIAAELNPHYHLANRPFFDRLEVKGGGDAVSAARAVLQTGEYDFGHYILAEEDVLRRVEGGTRGKLLTVPGSGVSHIQCNQSDPWRPVEAERSSAGFAHPCLGEAVVRTAVSLLVDRASIQEHLVGRNGQITANFLNAPERFRSTATSWEFNVDKAGQLLGEAGWVRGPDGVRVKNGRRLKLVFQAAVSPSVQKVQMVVKQAAAAAGIELEVKAVPSSVFFSSDPGSPDTNVRFLADLQMYTVFTGLDPQLFMAQFVSWEIPSRENKWTGRNLTRWRNEEYDRLWRQAETELDPVKRAALFIRMNDLVVRTSVVIPVTWRNTVHAVSNQLGGVEPNGWDSIFGRIAYWHRLASR